MAIGNAAGQTAQGQGSVAIGYLAGSQQAANSIVISALGTVVTGASVSGTFIAPIRGIATATPVLVYNAATNEITYNTSSIKYKKNVINLQQDTSKLYNITAREYDAKVDDKHYIGYIAEELDSIDTNFTWKNSDNLPEGIEWFNLLIYAIEEIKGLKNRIEILKNRIEILENK